MISELQQTDNIIKRAHRATQVIFLVCGLSVSSWAPMVPFVKDKLQLNDADLGLLLLCLGSGAIVTMPLTGWLISKLGSRRVIMLAASIIALSFPLVLTLNNRIATSAVLFFFGSGVGSIDVAMNSHGVHVQNIAGKHIMSSLHGLFSVGGLAGPVIVGIMIALGLSPLAIGLAVSIGLLSITFFQYNSLLNKEIEDSAHPNNSSSAKSGSFLGILNIAIVLLGIMCFIAFLTEGAVLDWSAVFLRDNKGFDKSITGAGYACFSIAMATMRLLGDRIVSRISGKQVVIYGSLIAFFGFTIIVFAPVSALVLIGFVLIGVGASNIVPVFFTAAGKIPDVPASKAVSFIGTLGYAGQLAGPAILGFIAHRFSLPAALFITGLLMLIIAILYQIQSKIKAGSK